MKKQNTETSGEYLDYTLARCLEFQKSKDPQPFAWMSLSECPYVQGNRLHLCTILLPKEFVVMNIIIMKRKFPWFVQN